MKRSVIIAVLVLSASALEFGVTPSVAQQGFALEAQIIGLRNMCWSGNRQACVRFGMIIGANQQRQVDWRRTHPEWWEWERW